MMNDDRRCRLLRVEHEFICQFDIDAIRIEQFEELRLVGDVRARGVAKAVTRALVALMEKLCEFRSVAARNAEFLADAFVPEFGEGFGGFDLESMKKQVILIVV